MSQRTLNSTGNKGRFLILDENGNNWTDRAYNSPGLALSVILTNGTKAAITLAAAGDLVNCGDGVYQVAVPDSAYTSLGDLTFAGVITDGFVVGFNQQVIAEVATASSFAKLFRWLGVLAGKGSDPATLAEIQATDGGATFDNSERSLEALGDAVGAAKVGDWAITRTFQISGGDKVSGVRMSLVGVAGKADTTGTDGVATIKTDDGTFTLRVVVPAGYEDVADTTVTINGADSVATVTLVATTVTPPANPAKSALEILCLDETGEPEADVAVDIRIAVVPSGDQNIAYKGTKQTATSDANGVARLEAIKGAEYEYKRGKAEVWNRVTIGSGDTTSVSSFIGSP
jgi:hypothetical protein